MYYKKGIVTVKSGIKEVEKNQVCDKHLVVLPLGTSDIQSIHIWTCLYNVSTVRFMSGVTHMETNVLFCSEQLGNSPF